MHAGRLRLIALVLGMASALGAQQPHALSITREWVMDGEKEEFNQINAVVVRKNLDLFVFAEIGDHVLRAYSADGRRTAVLGRKGAGPGEFRNVGGNGVGLLGDTLWAYDVANRRITYIGPDNKVLRTEPLPTGVRAKAGDKEVVPDLFGAPFVRAVYPNGDFLVHFLAVGKGIKPSWIPTNEDAVAWIRTDHAGVFKARVALMPSTTPAWCWAKYPNGGAVMPLCAGQYSEVTSDGSRLAMLFQDNRVAPDAKGSYRVVVLDGKGDTVYARVFPYTPVALKSGYIDSLIAARKDPPAEAALKNAPRPKSYAPIRDLKLGDDGTVWLRLWTGKPYAQDTQWMVLNRDGSTMGTITLPERSFIKAATANNLWVSQHSEDDVPSLMRFRLQRGQ